MAELIAAATSWQSLVLVLVLFGFAPGFVLRSLVKIYPRNDPRRAELIAQLYVLGRLERPLFVAEQLETVLFEGVPRRLKVVRRRGYRKGKPTIEFCADGKSACLLIQIEREHDDSNTLRVSHWRQRDSHSSSERGPDLVVMSSALQSEVDSLISHTEYEFDMHHTGRAIPLQLEIILPRELLHLPDELWPPE